ASTLVPLIKSCYLYFCMLGGQAASVAKSTPPSETNVASVWTLICSGHTVDPIWRLAIPVLTGV
ncbi:hypothetical protein NDU88_005888, partial [Pleurodeles waltl]